MLRYDLASMPDLSSLFPAILATHITLAICLLVPAVLLPFTLRTRSVAPNATPDQPGRVVRGLSAVQAHGTVVIGAGLALTGMAMIVVLGPRMLEQPWLLVSLATYAVAAVVAFAIQRPQLRKLQARDGIATDADRAAWRDRARRQRYVAYGLTSMVGLIAFLMSTKPQLLVMPRSAAIVNLGCKVNQSEMEGAARLLREAGVPLVDPDRAADLYLVNTCTVTATADEKSRAAVRRARRANPGADIVVTGCSVQVGPDAFAMVDPGARLVGNDGKAAFLAELEALIGHRRSRGWTDADALGRGPGGGAHRRDRRRPRRRRADAGVRQGPGRLFVLLHLLHHPASPWRGAVARPRNGPRRRPPSPVRGPPRDRAHRHQHRHLRRRLVGTGAPRVAHPLRPHAGRPRPADPGRDRRRADPPELDRAAARRRRAARGVGRRSAADAAAPPLAAPIRRRRRAAPHGSSLPDRRLRPRCRACPGGDPRRRRPRRRHRRLPDRGHGGIREDARLRARDRVRRPPRLPLLRPARDARDADGGPGRRADEEGPRGRAAGGGRRRARGLREAGPRNGDPRPGGDEAARTVAGWATRRTTS